MKKLNGLTAQIYIKSCSQILSRFVCEGHCSSQASSGEGGAVRELQSQSQLFFRKFNPT